MADNRHPTGPRRGAGFSLPAAAREANVSYRTFLAAAKRGDVQVVRFGGLTRVTTAEVRRVKAMFAEDAA